MSVRHLIAIMGHLHLLLASIAVGQEPVWIDQLGTTERDEAHAAASDGAGGVYIAGRTAGPLGGANAGDYDAFLARYDAYGTLLWTRQIGTVDDDRARALVEDGAGGVFLAGTTYGDLAAPNAGLQDAFLARYDADGNQLWIQQYGDVTNDYARAVARDAAGGFYVAGRTQGDLGGPNAGEYDAYIARYNGSGSRFWIRQFGTPFLDYGRGITADGTGGAVVTGYTDGSLAGPNLGDRDAYLIRYNSAGTQMWGRQLGTALDDRAYAVAPDGSGGVVVAGRTEGPLGGPNQGSTDAFLARYDGAGTQLWVEQFGTPESDAAYAVVADGRGGVFAAGETDGALGNGNPLSDLDAFVTAHDSVGDQIWVSQIGAPGEEDAARGLSSDGDGGAFVAGWTAGALEGMNAGSDDVFVARLLRDTDRDGLFDQWETEGIPYVTAAGNDALYELPGADPLHKDLYVEVDSMVGLGFHPTARANVIAAFANAPNSEVDNPDGLDGITLHLIVDETDLPVTAFPNGFAEFDTIKATRFGTVAERAVSDPVALLAAKARAFRYCIFGLSHSGGTSSGLAELPGNDFMVTLGLWSTPGGTVDQQAGTFMHEFGHALGLRHGGGDNIHHKPNYYSVMNYTWQLPSSGYQVHWRLDYSSAALPSLDEAHLNEIAGLGAPIGHFPGVIVPFGGGDPPFITYAGLAGGTPVDWNADGDGTDTDVAVDVNYLFTSYQSPSPGETLAGHNDWANLQYAFTGSNFADGVHDTTTADTEITVEIFDALNSIPPPAMCAADANLDGAVDVEDLLALLSTWGPCPAPCPTDVNGDGVVDVEDLLAILSDWGDCP